jgi:hypothetical protein
MLFTIKSMKAKLALLLVIYITACGSAFAAQATTVEDRRAFIKITEGDKHPGQPADRDAPDVLYVRKADILRVSVVFSTRSADFRVFLVTSGPILATETDVDRVVMTNTSKSYTYTFSSEDAALAFCEAIVASQAK